MKQNICKNGQFCFTVVKFNSMKLMKLKLQRNRIQPSQVKLTVSVVVADVAILYQRRVFLT